MKLPYPTDLIIFDFDGTLVDTREDIAASVNFALRRLGFRELSVETIASYVGDGVGALMERALGAGPQLVEEAVLLFRDHYGQHLLDSTRLYPGVQETLEYFRGKRKAIISNKPCEFTVRIAEGLGIARYFDRIMGGDSTAHQKPHPEPVEKVLQGLGIEKKATAIVGDSPMDIEMGKRAGLLSCAVTYGLRGREELERANPDLLLDDLYALTYYLC